MNQICARTAAACDVAAWTNAERHRAQDERGAGSTTMLGA
jgi:hypothetical protein